MSYLSTIHSPEDLKKYTRDQLKDIAREIREYLIETIPQTGGHFASSLGVVELTIALHYLYDMPRDKIIWDVGHQGYVHKLLTGRRESLKHIRQFDGISGFLRRAESPYDIFGAGHASTAISAALGDAIARDLKGKKYRVVAVIGDGSMTGGLAYEGLNNAGISSSDITVILNDNNMSISRNVGAISRYLVNMVTNPIYQKLRARIWDLTGKMPRSETIRQLAKKMEESVKTLVIPGMLFEDLGFKYYGPVDGHDLNALITIMAKIKDLPGPQLLHIITRKGKGFEAAEEDPIKYHGVKGSGKTAVSAAPALPAYLEVFGDAMVEIAAQNRDVVAITAAMTEGTGLVDFRDAYPERFFDVGIAEAHAVTFAAGLAAEGIKPVAAIYSTFLQRAFDQVLHDVSLQDLPVVFALDRAGIAGEDGPTHHGCFDISYLGCIPGIVISAPKNGRELRNLLYTGINYQGGPYAIRYPKESVPDRDWKGPFEKLPVGSWEPIIEGKHVLIMAVGSMVCPAVAAAGLLEANGLKTGVVNARFIKPFDKNFLNERYERYDYFFTIEENTLEGGFGDRIAAYFVERQWKTSRLCSIGIPDRFVTHGPRKKLLELVGLTPELIAQKIQQKVIERKKLVGKIF